MANPASDILLIGDDRFPPGAFLKLLEKSDPCFGKHWAKTVPECCKCLAPVLVEGIVHPLRRVCEARCKGASSPTRLNSLSVQEVIRRIEDGRNVQEIFSEILGGNDPVHAAEDAHHMLSLRFRYMRRELELPTPPLPSAKELLKDVQSQ